LEADVEQHRVRSTWQILCVCAALHACTSNRSPSPGDLSGTVIQGAGDNSSDAGTHSDASVGNAATGNGDTPPPDMMMSSGTGGSPATTGSGGQPATHTDAGTPGSGSGGSGTTTPPLTFDAGVGEPDDDDDNAPDAATDAGVDAGFGEPDDDEEEAP
jgi:hypothetical protein